ncbi:hypothetical protein NIES4106_60270 (plasmid) [Fischerella sp. NIES-4106]|nr:hypothetical protein NIES4106_60270 [Fischerella sp. NIES-4106]
MVKKMTPLQSDHLTTVRMFLNQAVQYWAALESSWQFAGQTEFAEQTEFDVAAEKYKQTPHLLGNCST